MKKVIRIVGIIVVLSIIIIALYTITKSKIRKKSNDNEFSSTIKAVVVKPEKSLLVMGTENTNELYSVNYQNKENIEFKQGQEILIYFDGVVLETYPAQITNVGKTVNEANIIHPDNIEEKNLLVKGVPYIEDGNLKVVIYTLNHSKSSERTYYEFVSNDNGVTWEFYKNK